MSFFTPHTAPFKVLFTVAFFPEGTLGSGASKGAEPRCDIIIIYPSQNIKKNSFHYPYNQENLLPVDRNKPSGHGQGAIHFSIPNDYALNLLATNIVFLVKLLNKPYHTTF
jgi:hypothetical protein